MSTASIYSSEEGKELGFWVYLMSDAVIFALLFTIYATMSRNFAGGPSGHELFELENAFYETLLLLLSTLTCGLAMVSAQIEAKKVLLFWLAVTLFLGIGFVVTEIREFQSLAASGAGPWRSGYLSAFFTLVGTHGLHVTIGSLWLAVMIAQLVCKGLTASVFSRLYRFSLFWHFLDLVWVGIFSVVYLPEMI
jgi:cytochrome o ubiquinol oxidase subunit 3